MKVSVLMITYNQERYIAQAIESVLQQQIDFPFEIVIGEDCSTDGTRDIIRKYSASYPKIIRPLFHEQNQGMINNLMQTFYACRGDYVAILEGDDYWTSPDKLQKQVKFLDANKDYSECFHNVKVIYEDESITPHPALHKLKKSTFTLKDIVSSFFIPTCSVLFRRSSIDVFPSWFVNMPMGDWPVHVLNAEKGKIWYMDEQMAAYRVHASGVWSQLKRFEAISRSINACETINAHLKFNFNHTIKKHIGMLIHDQAACLVGSMQNAQACRLAFKAWLLAPLSPRIIRRSFKVLKGVLLNPSVK